MVYLFEGIRKLFKDLPSLTELAICSGFDGFRDIGKAIEEEKRHEKVFDVRKLWESLTTNRIHGHGHGHAFPHPRFTHKDMDPQSSGNFTLIPLVTSNVAEPPQPLLQRQQQCSQGRPPDLRRDPDVA